MEKENVSIEEKILNSIFKCAKTATASIEALQNEVNDDNLSNDLKEQFQNYKDFESQAACKLYAMGSEPKGMNSISKAMLWSNIKLKTMTDESTSHLSNMLIQGTNMGILDLQKEINEADDSVSEESKTLANNMLNLMTDNINQLKAYL